MNEASDKAQAHLSAWKTIVIFTHDGMRVTLEEPPTREQDSVKFVVLSAQDKEKTVKLDADRIYMFHNAPTLVLREGELVDDPFAAMKAHLVDAIRGV